MNKHTIAKEYMLSIPDWYRLKALKDRILAAATKGNLQHVLQKSPMKSELNTLWKEIGEKYGFDYRSVRPAPNRSTQYVVAFPIEKIRGML